jgi:hypothetical protein
MYTDKMTRSVCLAIRQEREAISGISRIQNSKDSDVS